MAKTNPLLKEFAKLSKVSVDGWSGTQSGPTLLVSGIPSQGAANALIKFLGEKGLFCTLFRGERHSDTWNVAAREKIAGAYDDVE